MRTVLLFLLITASSVVSAQNILDSIKVYEYPVKKGVIYKYEQKSSPAQVCANSLSIVSVVTKNDSVYHFEEGNVVRIFPVDDSYCVVIKNKKNEFITYSNLDVVSLKKGDHVKRGMCVGTMAECSDETLAMDLNQVDILILRSIKQLPYRKSIEYIRSNISARKPFSYTL
jgi:hypothetical protein